MAIVRALRARGHVAYFAGGCVRDELLGLGPTDFDVATDATPDRIQSLFARTAEVGASFGVVLVKPGVELGLPARAGVMVEVATFRADGPYSDRRRPDSITFSDPVSDAQRRDFTINALFLDPDPVPRVIDHVGGQADLAARVIRAVGDPAARLAEDHLRALRALRFAARLGFAIEPATAAAIRAQARELRGVSRERIGEELRRMLTHPSAARAITLLEELALDAPVLDEPASVDPLREACSPRRGIELAADADGSRPPFTTMLGAWLVSRGLVLREAMATPLARVRGSLCLSNDEADALRDTLSTLHHLRASWGSASVARNKRRAAAGRGFPMREALRLLEAIDPLAAGAVRRELDRLARTPSGLAPEPWIAGDDLIALGGKPGPAFKGILDALYDLQLEDRLPSREQARAQARELLAKGGI